MAGRIHLQFSLVGVSRRWLLLILAVTWPSASQAWIDPTLRTARARIYTYHQGVESSGAVLRVVYFHPADREPLPEYETRVDRILTDISEFYREGVQQLLGDPKIGLLPLERRNGKLVIRVVRGKHPASHYTYESGGETGAEVREALQEELDFDREHVLILYGLSERDSQGRYVFNAPYYGAPWSDHQRGLCHAADCELLDPLLLAEKEQPFTFKEHYYAHMAMSLAKFNSWYLGGIAHELGHGLGFPHDNGSSTGSPNGGKGHSLMGNGNLHYREDRWGGEAPAYLSVATALRYIAHPLVTQSNKGRWEKVTATIEDLTAGAEKGQLRLQGRVDSSLPACAVIASVWPTKAKTDHGAWTFSTPIVDDMGEVDLMVKGLGTGSWHLSLSILLVNGAEIRERMTIEVDNSGMPDAAGLLGDRLVNLAEQLVMRDPEAAKQRLTADAIAAAPTEVARRWLQVLRAVISPAPEPIDLTSTKVERVFLSDAAWSEASVGWGQVVRNRYWFVEGRWQGVLLRLGEDVFEKGLYAHSESRYVFPLNGEWRAFTAIVGLHQGAAEQGSAVFTVRGDGRELYRSKILRAGQREEIKLDLRGVKELELQARGGEGHVHNSWAIWANPEVAR